jgi:hypothetical protein
LQIEINREAGEHHPAAASRLQRIAETKQGKQERNQCQESNRGEREAWGWNCSMVYKRYRGLSGKLRFLTGNCRPAPHPVNIHRGNA